MTTLSAAAASSSGHCNIVATSSPRNGRTTHDINIDIDIDIDTTDRTNELIFSDTPSDLFQLQPSFDLHRSARTNHVVAGAPLTKSSTAHSQPQPQPPQPAHQRPGDVLPPNATTPTPPSAPVLHPRKPSPGLAARLKALGFGSSRRSTSPPPSHLEPVVGRLPEEQLRKLDQGHQPPTAPPAVERRGRPWKAIARIPSRSSLKSNKHEVDDTVSYVTDVDVKPDLLPEILAPPPLDMDTNKYRLPDHTNGNGVKAQPDTRKEHIARDVQRPQTPPPPPPKDTPPIPQGSVTPANSTGFFNPDAYPNFNPLGLQRPGSLYTLSRASFANQLAQLTSIQLPDADSLSSRVSAIPTAQAATRALLGAAEQIRGWIYKASEVVGGLESEDDVEWAAAGGREGVEEVENAIVRFEELINVYVGAIEELQGRPDIVDVPTDDLKRAVAQMEAIMGEWAKIRNTLHNVRAQVEIAMEWEELWNMVLGDIQNEMDDLSTLVFEMEERRHKSILGVSASDSDLGDLETIVEETPAVAARLHPTNNRFSLPAFPASPSSPSPGASATMAHDDSSLLALFARMQPLRASLDFLPMRLSVFEARADAIFPSACEELEMRRIGLDASYKKLEKDAESLRAELGEDRWILVFRGAGRQAQKMYESVERSVTRLREGLDSGMHLTNQPMMSKKIENYEAKKTHYGPAIERVLGIIDKGVKDRLTVNGEILRLHAEMQGKWQDLKENMAEIDATLEAIEIEADKKGQQLRDSVSSMLSNDRSTIASSIETPQSSPPSSVGISSMGLGIGSAQTSKQRPSSHLPQPSYRRQSSLPAPHSQPRKPLTPRMSALSLSTPSREGSATPTGRSSSRPLSTLGNRPRWNPSTNTAGVDTGHNFKPLTLTTPSPYAKTPPTPVRSISALTPGSSSKLPTFRSPLARASTASPVTEEARSRSRPPSTSNRLSFRERLASSGATSSHSSHPPLTSLTRPRPVSHFSAPAHNSNNNNNGNRRASLQPPRPSAADGSSPIAPARPASSLASSRRTSLLPRPASRAASVTGRESPQALAGARFAMMRQSSSSAASSSGGGNNNRDRDGRPKWRGA
ncbi:cortical protein KAR9-domain-containing protein [Schizothecium vesticola]|uniref:Cortical protein KAR9-domain-containing protein n=1 Tax=Schizothecium vesticola TaxID=314040 RepID=A0AA40K4Y4_9PEZI|nr:cortical protein KAR9-domain-containing protein [Schizothecium vesticola]